MTPPPSTGNHKSDETRAAPPGGAEAPGVPRAGRAASRRMSGSGLRTVLGSSLLRRYFPTVATMVHAAMDAVTIFIACALAYASWEQIQPLARAVPFSDYVPLFAVITVVLLPLFYWFKMYRQQKTILNIAEFQGAFKACVLGVMIVGLLRFMLEESILYAESGGGESGIYQLLAALHNRVAIVPANTWSRYVVLLSFVFILVLISLERWICFKALQHLHLKGIGTTNILIIGGGRLGRMVQRRLFLSPRLGYNLAGFLDDDPALVGTSIDSAQVIASTDDLKRVVAESKVGLVLVASSEIPDARRAWIAETCRDLSVDIAFVPRLLVSESLPLLRASPHDAIPLLTFGIRRPGPIYLIGKRIFDLVVAGLAILLLLPLLLLLPILIRLESPGPAVFRQERVGKDGRLFPMFKFRSMRVDGPKYARSPQSAADPRLTRLGRLLRRTSLDELPQLFCVLKGDMSIVGPRPEMPFIVDSYDAHVRQRLLAKPGITGLWQISWARDAEIHENLDYDLYYVEHPSLTMDAVIVVLTVFSVVRGIGAH